MLSLYSVWYYSCQQTSKKRTLFFSLFLFILVSDHSKNIQNTRHILIQLEYFPLANHALLRHQCFFLQRLSFLVFEFILLLTFFPFSCSLFLNSNSSGLLHSVIHHQWKRKKFLKKLPLTHLYVLIRILLYEKRGSLYASEK